jgi:hypothetical protein
MSKKQMQKLYKLVGDCIVDLKTVTDNFLARQSFESIYYFTSNEFMQLCLRLTILFP